MSYKPKRIQLRRAKGWRLPANTVVVARPTKWGNPFIVGTHGTREHCVDLFKKLCAGLLCVSVDAKCCAGQQGFVAMAHDDLPELRGKNLACWCPLDKPCHADVLLEIANQ